MESFLIEYSILIPLLPLIGAMVSGFLMTGRRNPMAHLPIWIGVGYAAIHSILLLFGMISEAGKAHGSAIGFSQSFWTWIEAGNFNIQWGYWFDPLTAVMLCVVCGIGFLITVFAAGYMKGEGGYFRFFAYLGLFIFSMTNLVMGENLIMLYLGWEGVGLCSYLLIGYYYEKPAAREAAKKAFLVNRIGDFGFALGIMLCFLAFGTTSYFGAGVGGGDGLLEMATTPNAFQQQALAWIPFLLMLGAFGKSAQFPLYVWLPDAMEGPTPVSALIHAATMVTAGVYMIARCGTLFVTNEAAMITVAVVGAFTALFAATIALRQFDLKKVFAYSTVSQLGFMFVGVGVLAPVAGVFHLVTHAFFKALLFLSSGVVMHAMLGHLDMRKMSGLKTVLPVTRWLMLIGCLALAGVPLLSGFFSKDEIVAAAWHKSPLLGSIMLLTAFLTAYYTFRLYFRVFEGPTVVPAEPAEGHHGHDDHGHDAHGMQEHTAHAHASVAAVHTGTTHESGVDHAPAQGTSGSAHGHDDHHHNHEPKVMILPLIVLAIGALLAGYLNFPKHALGHFLGQSPSFTYTAQDARDYYNAKAHDDHDLVNPVALGQPEYRQASIVESEHAAHYIFMAVSGVIALSGIGLAYMLHLKDRRRGEALPEKAPWLARAMEAKYWVDEAYQAWIVEPLRALGNAFFMIDRFLVDGLVWMVGFVPQLGGFALKLTTQRGYLQGYALSMLLCIAVILLFVFGIL
jgi:NADH-quinone oxidoreductase subunit L